MRGAELRRIAHRAASNGAQKVASNGAERVEWRQMARLQPITQGEGVDAIGDALEQQEPPSLSNDDADVVEFAAGERALCGGAVGQAAGHQR